MNEKGEFTYNDIPCGIVYNKDQKNFLVAVYKDENRLYTEKLECLFPVKKYSDSSKLIAFHVANTLVLPSLLN